MRIASHDDQEILQGTVHILIYFNIKLIRLMDKEVGRTADRDAIDRIRATHYDHPLLPLFAQLFIQGAQVAAQYVTVVQKWMNGTQIDTLKGNIEDTRQRWKVDNVKARLTIDITGMLTFFSGLGL